MFRLAILFGCVFLRTLSHAPNGNYSVVVWDHHQSPLVREAAWLAAASVSSSATFPFSLNVQNVSLSSEPASVFEAYRQARQVSNLVAILGPQFSSQAVLSGIACADQIPVISVTATAANIVRNSHSSFQSLFRIVPTDDATARAFASVVRHYGWKRVALVRDTSSFALQGEIELRSHMDVHVDVVERDCSDEATCRAVLKELAGEQLRAFIVWAQLPISSAILAQAGALGFMSKGFAWLGTEVLTDAIEGMIDSDAVRFTGTCVIAPEPSKIAAQVELREAWLAKRPGTFPVSGELPLEALLAYDAVHAVARALLVQNGSKFSGAPMSLPGTPWTQGNQLSNSLRAVSFNGTSGPVSFGILNQRVEAPFQMRAWAGQGIWAAPLRLLASGGVIDLGTALWPGGTTKAPNGQGIEGLVLTATVGIYPPYTIYNEKTGTFGGFSIDILEKAAEVGGMAFNFSRSPVGTSKLVKNVLAGNFDVGVKGISVTPERFSNPSTYSVAYSQFSLRLVVKKSKQMKTNLFGFITPFSSGVWLSLLGTVVISGLLIHLFEAGEIFKSGRAGLGPALYFMANAFLGEGTPDGTTVRSTSARLLLLSTRVCSIVILTTFTAVLASNLVVQNMEHGIRDWKDLSSVSVAILGGGATEMITQTYSSNVVVVKSSLEALKLLANGEVDAVVENPVVARYLINHNEDLCDLSVIGEEQNWLPAAFALDPSMSPAVRDLLDKTITDLREKSGAPLRKLVEGYFSADSVCTAELGNSPENQKEIYTMDEIGGLFIGFLVLAVGVGVPLHFFEKRTKRGRFRTRSEGNDLAVGAKEEMGSGMINSRNSWGTPELELTHKRNQTRL